MTVAISPVAGSFSIHTNQTSGEGRHKSSVPGMGGNHAALETALRSCPDKEEDRSLQDKSGRWISAKDLREHSLSADLWGTLEQRLR